MDGLERRILLLLLIPFAVDAGGFAEMDTVYPAVGFDGMVAGIGAEAFVGRKGHLPDTCVLNVSEDDIVVTHTEIVMLIRKEMYHDGEYRLLKCDNGYFMDKKVYGELVKTDKQNEIYEVMLAVAIPFGYILFLLLLRYLTTSSIAVILIFCFTGLYAQDIKLKPMENYQEAVAGFDTFSGYRGQLPDTCLLKFYFDDVSIDGEVISMEPKEVYHDGNYTMAKLGNNYYTDRKTYGTLIRKEVVEEFLRRFFYIPFVLLVLILLYAGYILKIT